MPDINRIYQAIEFIEKNLKEDISIKIIAESVNFSIFHFCRLFNQVVKHPPYDYLIRRRISESAAELAETDTKIIDIAFKYQFNNPETFSRAFKTMCGIPPNEFRKKERFRKMKIFEMPSLNYLQFINKIKLAYEESTNNNNLILNGLMTIIEHDNVDRKIKLWDILYKELESISKISSIDYFYGISIYPQESKGIYFYMAAVEKKNLKDTSLLCEKKISQKNIIKLKFHSKFQEIDLAKTYIYQTMIHKQKKNILNSIIIEKLNSIRDLRTSDKKIELYIQLENSIN